LQAAKRRRMAEGEEVNTQIFQHLLEYGVKWKDTGEKRTNGTVEGREGEKKGGRTPEKST